jgi:hypothetical protein
MAIRAINPVPESISALDRCSLDKPWCEARTHTGKRKNRPSTGYPFQDLKIIPVRCLFVLCFANVSVVREIGTDVRLN